MMKPSTTLLVATALLLGAVACEKAKFNVDVPEQGVLQGKVTLENAEDHEGTEVLLPGTAWRATTDRAGNFAFYDIRSGTYELVARHEDYSTYRSEVLSVTPGRTLTLEPIVLSLDETLRTGTIVGTVVLEGADTHAGAIVALDGSPYTYATGRDGHFQFNDVSPGTYALSAQKVGYEWRDNLTVNLGPDGIVNVGEILLNVAGSEPENATGTAVVEGVAFRKGDIQRGGTLVEMTRPARSVETSATGFYRIRNVPAGPREFTFSHPGFFPLTTVARIEAATTNVLQTVRLRERAGGDVSPGVLEGYVNLEDAEDNSGVTVELLAANEDEPPQTSTTSYAGRFVFRDAPDGTYRIRASKEGYIPMTVFGIEIRDGISSDTPIIQLQVDTENANDAEASLEGRALLEGEQDHGGILIALDGTSNMTKTDASGFFRLEGLGTGNYTLRATKERFKPVILDRVVIPGTGVFALEPFVLESDVDWIEVMSTTPADGTDEVVLADVVPVRIQFDRPVIGASAKDAVLVRPAVALRMFHGSEHPLADPNTLYIELLRSERPAVRFEQEYQVLVQQTVRDYVGNTMREPHTFNFATAGARIIGTWPEDGEEVLYKPEDAILVDFNTRVDADRLRNAFNIRPDPGSVPLVYTERTDFGSRAVFQMDLDENRRYTVTIGDRIRTDYGERVENTPYRFRFETRSLAELPAIGEDIPIDQLD